MNKDLTIFYAVVGPTYKNLLLRSLLSLKERISFPYKVKVISPDLLPEEIEDVEIIKYYGPTGDLTQKHHNWQMRYYMQDYIDTDYAMYLDADTVFVNDNLEDIIAKIGTKFGLCRHFWVPTIKDYVTKALPYESKLYLTNNIVGRYLDLSDNYYASGAFIFANTPINIGILNHVLRTQKKLMPDHLDYIEGMTDEFWLASTISIYNLQSCIYELNGAFNHCCEPPMPLALEGQTLVGKNPQDEVFEKVTVAHCDITRRIPGYQYGGEIARKVKELFYL